MKEEKSLNTLLLKTILEKINSMENNQKIKKVDRKSFKSNISKNINFRKNHFPKSLSPLNKNRNKYLSENISKSIMSKSKSYFSKNIKDKIFRKSKSRSKSKNKKKNKLKLKELQKFLNENPETQIPKVQIYFS